MARRTGGASPRGGGRASRGAGAGHVLSRPVLRRVKSDARAQARRAAVPRCVGAIAERLIGARNHPVRLKRLVARSLVPIVVVDDDRRYLEVNIPARQAFRLSLSELRRRRIDDLTPPEMVSATEAAWERLMTTGCVARPYEVTSPDGSRFAVTYYALANALPGQHVIAFAPEWADEVNFSARSTESSPRRRRP